MSDLAFDQRWLLYVIGGWEMRDCLIGPHGTNHFMASMSSCYGRGALKGGPAWMTGWQTRNSKITAPAHGDTTVAHAAATTTAPTRTAPCAPRSPRAWTWLYVTPYASTPTLQPPNSPSSTPCRPPQRHPRPHGPQPTPPSNRNQEIPMTTTYVASVAPHAHGPAVARVRYVNDHATYVGHTTVTHADLSTVTGHTVDFWLVIDQLARQAHRYIAGQVHDGKLDAVASVDDLPPAVSGRIHDALGLARLGPVEQTYVRLRITELLRFGHSPQQHNGKTA